MSSGSDSGTVGMQLETRATFSSKSRNIMSIMNDFVDSRPLHIGKNARKKMNDFVDLVESRIERWLELAFPTK